MKKALFFVAIASVTAVSLAVFNSNSGLNVGENVTPFHPKHIAGPDKGTDTCPPCKYGAVPAVQAWISPSEKPETVLALAQTLSANVEAHKAANLKGFMIMLTMCAGCEGRAAKFAEKSKLENIGIATLAFEDKAIKNYKVSLEKDVK